MEISYNKKEKENRGGRRKNNSFHSKIAKETVKRKFEYLRIKESLHQELPNIYFEDTSKIVTNNAFKGVMFSKDKFKVYEKSVLSYSII